MTQEEKAKAYDEVRKKIAIRFGSNVANEIFSQFEESDDERINEWLINLVKGHIAWLKDRVGEQLSNGQVYGDELVKAKNSLSWLGKQGEKPTDEDIKEVLHTEYEKGRADVIAEMQNPAWSEEDKAMVEDIIEAIDTQYAVTDYNEMVNWLKSLKDKYTWKPSDKQMEAVRIAAEIGTANKSWAMGVLSRLYQDLKKLREE